MNDESSLPLLSAPIIPHACLLEFRRILKIRPKRQMLKLVYTKLCYKLKCDTCLQIWYYHSTHNVLKKKPTIPSKLVCRLCICIPNGIK